MIGDPHRRLPVRYESDRLPGAFRLERFQDDGFVEAVEIAGRLVQEEERRVVQKRAGQSEPLAFAAGQCIAEFADRRIVSFRERQANMSSLPLTIISETSLSSANGSNISRSFRTAKNILSAIFTHS